MKENVTLLQEINDLQKEVHTLDHKIKLIERYEATMGAGGGGQQTGRSKLMEQSMRSQNNKD
jgi:hypothetical protein